MPGGHEGLNLSDLSIPRVNLLKSFVIVLLHAADDQYTSVMRLCGSVVCKLFETNGATEYLQLLELAEAQRALSGDNSSVYSQGAVDRPTFCLFHDDCLPMKQSIEVK